jgi:putative ABC transport system ATP-binding protein
MSIALHDLKFHYPKSATKPVLNIDTWHILAKEKLFIHGPSGCGKSTLLNLISGILSPSYGEINFFGEPLHHMNARQRDRFRANNIGYVFQQFNLIPYLNAIENIELASHFSKKMAKTPLRKNIQDLLARLALSEANWHKPVSQLSIGQQQRIAIARALINQPKLFIADEPTSSLDQQNTQQFMSLLMSLCDENDMTLLFVSHDTRLSYYFDRIQSLPSINLATSSQPCF